MRTLSPRPAIVDAVHAAASIRPVAVDRLSTARMARATRSSIATSSPHATPADAAVSVDRMVDGYLRVTDLAPADAGGAATGVDDGR